MPDEQIKVLLLAGRFEVRGSSSATLRLTDRLHEHEVDARVICANAQRVDPRRRSRLPIVEYSRLDLPILGQLMMRIVLRDVSNDVPDLIHIQSRHILAKGTWLARQLKRPFVLTVHDYLQPNERLSFDLRFGRRIITVSDSVRDDLIERTGIPEDRLTTIHSGVEVRVPTNTLPVLDTGHVPVIGTAGPLEAVKGLPFFLKAAAQVLSHDHEVEFLIAGAGPEEGNLRRLARDLGIGQHVTFVPNLYGFSESLAAMDIFCLPSLRQGLGTIMLEAMAFGKPVIATAVGGVYSVVRDDETGLIVPPSDSEKLAEKIMQLLKDPVKARAIGANAASMVQEQFGVEKMVKRTADVYREVLAETAGQFSTEKTKSESS